MKKLKLLTIGVSIIIGATVFIGCGGDKKEEGSNSKGEQTEKFIYDYNDGKENLEVKVTEPPKRAVTLSQFMTEMLLSLGLQDRMVATALLDNPILPQYKEAYEKIPVLKITGGHSISKEAFMALNPDFVSGWEMSISNETTGTAKELIAEGIKPFVAESLKGNATIDTVYEDYKTLGKIFAVEDTALEVINNMKEDVKEVEEKLLKEKKDKVDVMVYDSGEKEAMVVGGGLPNNLITLAGGKNIYGELKNTYETVSFESIVEKDPEVIIVTEFLAGEKAEKKIQFLKSNQALKDVKAVKNNRFYVIELADLSPGIRNSKAIKEINEMLYGK
ncbi:ABC transporter substrate-binding protein [uncultured Clostridium sp.]|uniref:ABC transporter substrate-binding protein n=1 Tax=uncultured Clostridium sp. TaxID=59620 RepID=UPI00260B1D16|nr:ABC transporter substrate-binding protein [uncultured Clostridium sp.]